MEEYILEVNHLKTYFPIYKGLFKKQIGEVKAVDDITLAVPRGKTVAIVGESGSGKTTLAKTIMKFYQPNSGSIIFNGKDITSMKESELKTLRKEMQMVYQDPSSSLNPRKRIKQILEEPLLIHGIGNASERFNRVKELMDIVELPLDYIYRYPHSLSGGQKQRIGIARALALNPSIICLDEPTSALDVSVQAKIISLLKKLQAELHLTYLFITHDLGLVRNFADIVGVMYLGSIVEIGTVENVYNAPLSPYTQSLLSSVPVVTEEEQSMLPAKIPLQGDIPSPSNMPVGCKFHTRCPYKEDICLTPVDLIEAANGSKVRCHLTEQIMGK